MAESKVRKYLDELITRYPILESVESEIWKAFQILEESFLSGGKILVAGNGGSAADSEHIVGELMKGFVKKRELSEQIKQNLIRVGGEDGEILGNALQGALPAIALVGNNALDTAYANDVNAELVIAQSVYGYGNAEDVFLAISTSGNAVNLNYAMIAAKVKGLKCIALTGKDGGKLKEKADLSIIVPEQETFKIQELHLPIYHVLCLMLEEKFFANNEESL